LNFFILLKAGVVLAGVLENKNRGETFFCKGQTRKHHFSEKTNKKVVFFRCFKNELIVDEL
jgi:hypothetical protein